MLAVVKEHPGYGYRRIGVELRARGVRVNHNRLRRVLHLWDLALPRKVARPRPSGVRRILRAGRGKLDLVSGREMGPLAALSTDFTEIRYAGGTRKAYLMAMVDVESAWVPGWAVGSSANRDLALRCWEEVKQALAHIGGHGTDGLIVHHDQDTVYTSYDWLQRLLIRDRARVSFAEHGARDNPWIESLWGHFKVENGSLRRHSGLGYRAPVVYLKEAGIHPRVLVETGPQSGSVSGAQVYHWKFWTWPWSMWFTRGQ